MPRNKVQLTDSQIASFELMTGFGLTLEQTARVLGLNLKTLQRRKKDDERVKEAFVKGSAIALSEVAKTAFNMAVSGECPAMTMFWLKCRAGWREASKVPPAPDVKNPPAQVVFYIPKNGSEAKHSFNRHEEIADKNS